MPESDDSNQTALGSGNAQASHGGVAKVTYNIYQTVSPTSLWAAVPSTRSPLGTPPQITPTPVPDEVGHSTADISRVIKFAPARLIGREDEVVLLNDAWNKVAVRDKGRPHILSFVALGGEGKTSLVAKWASELAFQEWPNCDGAFAWSFYSQGTREQVAASSDLFLKEALIFFGDDADRKFASSNAGAFEKGQRLARLVGRRRNLLILDGLEPLQYAPTSPTPGELKDQGIAALLRSLAVTSHGLCVVTTRYSLPDLKAFWQTTAPENKLLRLSCEASMHLLQSLGVTGPVQEFKALAEEVKGHALTLTLLGGFLKRAFHGDIRQRDRVKFEKADEKIDGGHAFRTMAAYEQWLLRDGGDEGQREVAILRLMGLFDRPANAGCLMALQRNPIAGLTDPLIELADYEWEYCISGLEAAKLLTVNRDTVGVPVSLDAHPHLREYFAKQLREQNPAGWKAAHTRLYEYLCDNTADKAQPTLEDLQPLYQAVAHGCHAGLYQEAFEHVYNIRLQRGMEHYPHKNLGAVSTDLGCIAGFFLVPWTRLADSIPSELAGRVLDSASESLHSIGRLGEARQAMETLHDVCHGRNRPVEIANSEILLSEVSNSLGELDTAIKHANKALARSERKFQTKMSLAALGFALHQQGYVDSALDAFRAAESLESKRFDGRPFLCSLPGYAFGDLLIDIFCRISDPQEKENFLAELQLRAGNLLEAAKSPFNHLAVALSNLLLMQIQAAATHPLESPDGKWLIALADQVVSQLRGAGDIRYLPRGLLIRASLRALIDQRTGSESAQTDLDEAWDIAERGPMKLLQADILLNRVQLFLNDTLYPWKSAHDDVAAAERLIDGCGYHRRDKELAATKKAILK